MRGERSFGVAALGACAAHTVAIALVLAIRAPRVGGEAPRESVIGEIEVAREEPIAEQTPAGPVGATAARPGARARRREAARDVVAQGATLEGQGATVAEVPWSFSALDPSRVDAGVGEEAFASATRAGVGAVVMAEGARAEPAALRDAMRPRDHAVLMGAAGVLVPFTREAVRGSRAPLQGDAHLEYRVDRAGKVTQVLVVDASSEHSLWEEVAQDLVLHASSRVVPVPAGAQGVAVRLDVSSYVPSLSGVGSANEVSTYSPLQERFDMHHPEVPRGSLVGTKPQQPRKLDLVIGPNQIDLTVGQGLGDLAVDAVLAARRVVAVRLIEERPL